MSLAPDIARQQDHAAADREKVLSLHLYINDANKRQSSPCIQNPPKHSRENSYNQFYMWSRQGRPRHTAKLPLLVPFFVFGVSLISLSFPVIASSPCLRIPTGALPGAPPSLPADPTCTGGHPQSLARYRPHTARRWRLPRHRPRGGPFAPDRVL